MIEYHEGQSVSRDSHGRSCARCTSPFAIAAGLHVTNKFTDLLFELAQDWLRGRNTRAPRWAYILGPNGNVVRCFQINGAEMEDVTERTAGSRGRVPLEDSKM